MRGLLIFFMMALVGQLQAQCADAGKDTLICGFTFGIPGSPEGGTWTYFCKDSTRFVEMTPSVNSTVIITVPYCGTYSFIYTINDVNCTDNDTVDISFEDPATQTRSYTYDLGLEYGTHSCHGAPIDSCGNIRTLKGPDAPRPLWTIKIYGECNTNFPDPIITNRDSASCTAIVNHIGAVKSDIDSAIWFSSQNAFLQVDLIEGKLIENRFERFIKLLEDNIEESFDTTCRPMNKCFVEDDICVDTILDSTQVVVPIHIGGRWHLVDASGSTPLNDSTFITTRGKDYYIIIDPTSRFFGNGNVTFSVFSVESGDVVDLDTTTTFEFFWMEEWSTDTIYIVRDRLMANGNCINCGSQSWNYGDFIMPEAPSSFCPTLSLTFDPPIKVNITGDTLLCPGGFVIIDGGPDWVTRAWSNNVSSRFNFVDSAGVYILEVTDTMGCKGTGEIEVFELERPDFIIETDTTNYCQGDIVEVRLTTSDTISSYFWSNAVVDTSTNIKLDRDTVFYVTVIDTTGCEHKDSIIFPVLPRPDIDAGEDQVISCLITEATLMPDTLALDTLGFFEWKGPGINLGNKNVQKPIVGEPGIYILFAGSDNSTCLGTDTVLVTITDSTPVASAGARGLINCANDSITLDGSGSSFGPNIEVCWVGQGITPQNKNDRNPTIGDPGDYIITVCNVITGCCSSDSVGIGFNISQPRSDAGPDKVLSCDTTSVTLGGPLTSMGFDETYRWSGPGINGLNRTLLNPTVTEPGTYFLLVTDTVSICTSNDAVLVTQLGEIPVANAGDDKFIDCENPSVVISAGGSSSGPSIVFNWEGPGITMQNQMNPFIQVSEEGEYILTVTDTLGNCVASDTINVISLIDYPDITAGPDTIIDCSVSSIKLQGNIFDVRQGLLISWEGPSIFSGSKDLINPEINLGGIYILTVTDTVSKCVSMDTVIVVEDFDPAVVDAGPDLEINCDLTSVQLMGQVSNFDTTLGFYWEGPSGIIIRNNERPNTDQPGIYILKVDGINANCSSTDTMAVTLDTISPIVSAGPDSIVGCPSDTITIQGTSTDANPRTIEWTTVGGNIIGNNNQLNIVIDKAGTYTLRVVGENGCVGTDIMTITDWEPFDVLISGLEPSCANNPNGRARIFISNGSGPFTFSLNGGPFTSTQDYNNLEGGSYDIVVMDGMGCSIARTFDIEELEGINFEDITDTVSLCDADIVTIGDDPGLTDVVIKWDDDDSAGAIRVVMDSGIYILRISNQCDTVIQTYIVTSGNLPKDIFDLKKMPNIFSPNGDGSNDVFRPILSDPDLMVEFDEFEFVIYSRWGERVFKGVEIDQDWDGTFKGKDMPQDVYYYIISAIPIDCEGNPGEPIPVLKGDVLLAR